MRTNCTAVARNFPADHSFETCLKNYQFLLQNCTVWKYSICCKSSHQPILCTLKFALLPCSPTKFSLWHASAAHGNPKQLILFLITFQNLVIFAPWAPPGLLAFSSVATSHLTFAQNWFPNLVIIWPPGHPVLSWHFDFWLSGILPIRTSGWLVPFFT